MTSFDGADGTYVLSNGSFSRGSFATGGAPALIATVCGPEVDWFSDVVPRFKIGTDLVGFIAGVRDVAADIAP